MTWGKKSGKLELLSLADEILLRILSFLGGPDLLTFSTVCKHAKAFYESSSLLQYIAELDFTGCTDESLNERYEVIHTYHAKDSSAELDSRDGINGAKALSISEKLSYLRKREYNWRTLDLAQNAKKVKLQRPIEVGAHDLDGTVLGFFERGRVNMMEYIDMTEVSLTEGVWIDPSADCNVQGEGKFPELPGDVKILMSDVSLKQWTFDANVADLRLHLEDDLIAFVTYGKEGGDDTNEIWSLLPIQEIKLNLCQFSTECPHPWAKEPIIKPMEMSLSYGIPQPSIEVVGKHIVILVHFPRSENNVAPGEDLFVINWHSGALVPHRPYPASWNYGCIGAVTPSLFVMTNFKENTLDLVHIHTPFEDDRSERVVLLCRLRLPALVKDHQIASSSCRADPSPSGFAFDPLKPNSCSVSSRASQWHGLGRDSPFSSNGTRCFSVKNKDGPTSDPLRALVTFKFVTKHARQFSICIYTPSFVIRRSVLASHALSALNAYEGFLVAAVGSGERTCTQIPDDMIVLPGVKEGITWKNWGPDSTRWIREDAYHGWVMETSGQRHVVNGYASNEEFTPGELVLVSV